MFLATSPSPHVPLHALGPTLSLPHTAVIVFGKDNIYLKWNSQYKTVLSIIVYLTSDDYVPVNL